MFSGIGGFREGRGFWPWGHKRTKVSLGRPKSLHCKEPAKRFCRRQNDAVLRRQASTRAGDFVCVGHCEMDEKADQSYRALFDCKGRRFCHGPQAEHIARIGMAKCKPPAGLARPLPGLRSKCRTECGKGVVLQRCKRSRPKHHARI